MPAPISSLDSTIGRRAMRSAGYDEAATLIERGLSLDPSFGPLVANERLVRDRLGD